MANINEKVMDMVRREVAKNPDVKSSDLYEEAKKLDRSISSLSLRQFHARYPLQVKRAMKSGARVSKPRKAAAKKKRGTRKAATKRGRRKAGARKKAATKKTASRRKTVARKGRAAKKTRPAAKKTRKRATPKRTRRPAKRAATGSRRKAAGEGGTVRSVLLKFAAQVASAEDKADMIQVIADMDRWVERVMKAAR